MPQSTANTGQDGQDEKSLPVSNIGGDAAPSSGDSTPFAPQPNDTDALRAPAYVDSAEILVAETYPVQVTLVLSGSLPTPCHQLRVRVAAPAKPTATNELRVEVYSMADPDKMCAEVLAPFEVRIPLGSHSGGTFGVWVNDKRVGEFKA